MPFRGLVTMPSIGDLMVGDFTLINGAAQGLSANELHLDTFVLPRDVAFKTLRFVVVTQAGNFAVAIYDQGFQRLLTTGSQPVPAAGRQSLNLGNWALRAGRYWAAFVNDGASVFGYSCFAGSNPAENVWRGSRSASFPPPVSLSGPAPSFNAARLFPWLHFSES